MSKPLIANADDQNGAGPRAAAGRAGGVWAVLKWPASSFIGFLRFVVLNRAMVRSWVVRDIRSRYMGSSLGILWSLLHPLSQFLIYYFVFAVVMRTRLAPEYGGASFAVWLMVGLLPWMFFAEVVLRAPALVLENANLVKKTVFPSEILSLSHLAAALINHLVAFVLLLGLIAALKQEMSFQMLYVVPHLAALAMFALGCSWLISSLNVFLRDIAQVLGVVVNIWFYMTPIIYPLGLVPDKFQSFLRWNPMLHVVEGYRISLLGKPVSNFQGLLYLSIAGVSALALGGLVFKKLRPQFPDVL